MFPRHAWSHACGLRLQAQAFQLAFGQIDGQAGSESADEPDAAMHLAEASCNADVGETKKFAGTDRKGAAITDRAKYKAQRQCIASEVKAYDPVLQRLLGLPPSSPQIVTPSGKSRSQDVAWKLEALPNNNRTGSHVYQHLSARNYAIRTANNDFALNLTPKSARAVVLLQRMFRRQKRVAMGMQTCENGAVAIQRWFRRIRMGIVAAEAVARRVSGLRAKYKAQRQCIASEVKAYDPVLQRLLGLPPSSPQIVTPSGKSRSQDVAWKPVQKCAEPAVSTSKHHSPQPAGPGPNNNATMFQTPKSEPSTCAASIDSDQCAPSSQALNRVTAVLSRFNVSVSRVKTPTANAPMTDKSEYWFSCPSSVHTEHAKSDCESGVTVTADIVISKRGNQTTCPDNTEHVDIAENSPSVGAETPPATGLLVGVRLPPRLHVRLTEIDFASLTRIIDQNFLHPAWQPGLPMDRHLSGRRVQRDPAGDDPARRSESVPQRVRIGEQSAASARGELKTMSANERLKSFLFDELAIEVTHISTLPFVFKKPALL